MKKNIDSEIIKFPEDAEALEKMRRGTKCMLHCSDCEKSYIQIPGYKCDTCGKTAYIVTKKTLEEDRIRNMQYITQSITALQSSEKLFRDPE